MNAPWPLVLLICVLLLAAAVHLFLPTGRSRTQTGTPADRLLDGDVFRDDDRYWIRGTLYNNPDDLALFVSKYFGLGQTVNIGRPLGRAILFGPLLPPLSPAILKAPSR